MSLVVYDTSLKGSRIIAELGTTNNALIESSMTLASTDSEVVHTSGNSQTVAMATATNTPISKSSSARM